MNIRFATHDDIPALHDLVERAYRGDSARQGWTHEADLLDGQRTDPAALRDTLADPKQAIVVVEEKGAVVGCVQIADRGNGLAYLGMLSVEPARQAGGLGRLLLKAGEDEAETRFGARRIEMTVIVQRSKLIAYYSRRGYTETGETRPFPFDDERFGIARTGDLVFTVLAKDIPG